MGDFSLWASLTRRRRVGPGPNVRAAMTRNGRTRIWLAGPFMTHRACRGTICV